MSILSEADHAFFRKNGYVVVHDAVPRENLDAAVDAIWEFLGMDPDRPDDWYREPHRRNGMVELYQHQALWDNRQHPRVHAIFSEIWETERLWVSIDRACMKPPAHPDHPEYDDKGFIHWDLDTSSLPVSFGVQGVLYLADTDVDQGGFQCVPELFREFDAWVESQPADRDPRKPDLTGYEIKPIPGRAGDLVIWHKLLAHGNGHNVSDRPRLAQYISMYPAREADAAARDERVRQWREHCPPRNKTFPGDARMWEERNLRPAELTSLGRRLLGVDRW